MRQGKGGSGRGGGRRARLQAPASLSSRLRALLRRPRHGGLLGSNGALAAAMGLMLLLGVALGLGLGQWLEADTPAVMEPAATAYRPSPAPSPAPSPQPPSAPTPTAAVLPPPSVVAPPAPEADAVPAWRRYAVPAPEAAGRPMVAVVIDDMGVDRGRSRAIADLPGPLTTAFLSYADDLRAQTRAARRRGHELLVHMAMEPRSTAVDPGPDVLRVSDSNSRIRALVADILARFDGVVGVNNHMGSRFTADERAMRTVLGVLKERGMLFLDSLTTDRSVAAAVAGELELPFAERHVFLDNQNDVALVRRQLTELERVAEAHGYAVGIGHPRDATIAALAEWLPELEAKGLVLVPLSAVVRERMTRGGGA